MKPMKRDADRYDAIEEAGNAIFSLRDEDFAQTALRRDHGVFTFTKGGIAVLSASTAISLVGGQNAKNGQLSCCVRFAAESGSANGP